jgi:hypothetical protein
MRRPPLAIALPVAPWLVPSRVSGPSVPAGAWLQDFRILADDTLDRGDTSTDRFAKAGTS